ncbi:hypothetical protein EWM64_g6451 [Hericium alpestre]|uniref:Uncharacterized protein n=1 Tax=Hericium alpestre TaxID=135208 RepID=A0A4Y9ZUP3_9AGAM|nr:hypothetical protein EWM64_g6451 [Hericium alpestre]
MGDGRYKAPCPIFADGAAQTNATASFPSENPSYSVTDWIISIHCAICKAPEKGAAFLCHPQARLRWDDQSRVTDFGAILLHDRPSAADKHPAQPSRLIYIAEIKPKDHMDDWRASSNATDQCQAFESHISQVSEQAYFAFRQYAMKLLHAFLIIGNNFVFFEYKMPKDIAAYAPCRKVDTSDNLGKLLSDPNPRKRRRVASSTGPCRMLEPNVIFAYEEIINATGRSFSPPFRKALDMTIASHVKTRQPSWFQVPPGDHLSPETSLELAYAQIKRAADEVSGKALQDAIALAAKAHPLPKTPENKDPFKASTWLEIAASALPPKRNTSRSSRASSVCSYNEDIDEAVFDSEPGPSSSSSSLVNDSLADLSADDEAPLPPDSSRPSSPADWPALYEGLDSDHLVAAPALAEEVLLPKRKTRLAQGHDALEARALEQQRKAMAGKDTKGKGRDI